MTGGVASGNSGPGATTARPPETLGAPLATLGTPPPEILQIAWGGGEGWGDWRHVNSDLDQSPGLLF